MQHNLISFLSKGKAVSKILSCCAVLVFVFVLISTDYQASAAGVPIQVPTVPFELGPLIKSYDDLTDEQKKIADAIAGGYGTAYSGYAGYSYDGTWTDAAHELSEQITKYGSNIYNTFRKYLGDTGTELLLNPVGFGITALQDLLGGAVSYASQWSGTFADWWDNNIYDADAGGGGGGHSFVVDGDVNMNQGFMNLFGPGSGLFDWQSSASPFVSDFIWKTFNISGIVLTDYYSYFNQLNQPVVRFNYRDTSSVLVYRNYARSSSYFSEYHNLFINTSSNQFVFCNDNGQYLGARDYIDLDEAYIIDWTSYDDEARYSSVSAWSIFVPTSYNNSSYNSYVELVQAIFNSEIPCYNSNFSDLESVCFSDFVNRVYVGASWAQRQEVVNIDDLNFDDTYERTVIDNPAVPWALDLAKLIRSLIDKLAGTRDAVDGVTIRDATIGATIDKVTGLDITNAQVQKIAVQVEYPESGIIIPDGIFGDSMSYIEYLWNFTKPLVLYTRDLLHTLLFNGNGIAWIVYGIISVGLIGGVIVKFLL